MDVKIKWALQKLTQGNEMYIKSLTNPADISSGKRKETSKYGQKPYAVILTCSDSRVSPEHIFSTGIGDLFIVRTAGNVAGAFELGSIEYAIKHLHASIVVVMGHTQCGAVIAAIEGHAEGCIEDIIHEIQLGLEGALNESQAIYMNIQHSKQRVLKSEIVQNLINNGKLLVIGAEYNIETGFVKFL